MKPDCCVSSLARQNRQHTLLRPTGSRTRCTLTIVRSPATLYELSWRTRRGFWMGETSSSEWSPTCCRTHRHCAFGILQFCNTVWFISSCSQRTMFCPGARANRPQMPRHFPKRIIFLLKQAFGAATVAAPSMLPPSISGGTRALAISQRAKKQHARL